MRHEPCIDVAGHSVGIVSQGHRCTTGYKYVGDNTPPGKTLPQGSEGALKFRPAKKDIARIAHAASRSRAER
jgi:hypothetical protein